MYRHQINSKLEVYVAAVMKVQTIMKYRQGSSSTARIDRLYYILKRRETNSWWCSFAIFNAVHETLCVHGRGQCDGLQRGIDKRTQKGVPQGRRLRVLIEHGMYALLTFDTVLINTVTVDDNSSDGRGGVV